MSALRRTLISLVAVVVAALSLAACGGEDDSATSSSVFNQADVAFAQQMIPHHQQAVEMAKLAPTRAASQEVKDLAAAIEAAQAPEIATMRGFLKEWGEPEKAGGTGDMGDMEGMDHGSMDHGSMDHGGSDMAGMPGMMTDTQMAALEASSGEAFDTAFLTMMIAHHEGAITMAKTEQADGRAEEAIALAKEIEAAQTDEIATMQALLAR